MPTSKIVRMTLFFISMLVLLVLAQSFDILGLSTRYLYFSTELLLCVICGWLYWVVFASRQWRHIGSYPGHRPLKGKAQSFLFSFVYFGMIVIFISVWVGVYWHPGINVLTWIHFGLWGAFFIGCTLFFWIFMIHRQRYVHWTAMLASSVVNVFVLIGFESIMLHWGHAWNYQGTILKWAMGIPMENILFVYPFTPAFCIMAYSWFARSRNDLRAFWFTFVLLFPTIVIVETGAVYFLNLWVIFPDYSVWPIGRTSLEEYLFYAIFLVLSLLSYLFLEHHIGEVKGQYK